MPSDNFNDNALDYAIWRKCDPEGSGVINERNSRIEVDLPQGYVEYTPLGLKTMAMMINDLDVTVDVAVDEGMRRVTFCVGKDPTYAPNPGSWAFPRYQIAYAGSYYGGWLVIKRVDVDNTETIIFNTTLGFQSYIQFRIRIIDGTIYIYYGLGGNWNLVASESCQWILDALSNIGIVSFQGETEGGIEGHCKFDNYLQRLASEPEPVYRALWVRLATNGITIPKNGAWIYPDGWQPSVYALPTFGSQLLGWSLNGGELPPDNPVIISLTSDLDLTPSFSEPVLATIHGIVSDANTGGAIIGALVVIEGITYTDVQATDNLGRYSFGNIPAEAYNFNVSAEGYQTATDSIDASAGGDFTMNFGLEPIVGPTPCPFHAAYLPYSNHPDLIAIRRFRDYAMPLLLRRLYYRCSPLLTPLIINKPRRKYIARQIVKAVRRLVECALNLL